MIYKEDGEILYPLLYNGKKDIYIWLEWAKDKNGMFKLTEHSYELIKNDSSHFMEIDWFDGINNFVIVKIIDVGKQDNLIEDFQLDKINNDVGNLMDAIPNETRIAVFQNNKILCIGYPFSFTIRVLYGDEKVINIKSNKEKGYIEIYIQRKGE